MYVSVCCLAIEVLKHSFRCFMFAASKCIWDLQDTKTVIKVLVTDEPYEVCATSPRLLPLQD